MRKKIERTIDTDSVSFQRNIKTKERQSVGLTDGQQDRYTDLLEQTKNRHEGKGKCSTRLNIENESSASEFSSFRKLTQDELTGAATIM